MKTEDIDKRIGMPDVDKEWARFEQEVIGKETKRHSVLAWALGIGIAASVALLIIYNIGKEQTEQTTLIVQTEEIKPQPTPQPIRKEMQAKEQELVTKVPKPVIAHNKKLALAKANAPAASSLDIPAREYTGAVQKFKMDDIEDLAFESVDQALQGQIAERDIASADLGSGTTMHLRGIGESKTDSFLVVVNGKKLFDSRGMTSEEIDKRIEEYLNEQGLLQDIKIPWNNGAIVIWASTPEEREELQRMIANLTIVPKLPHLGSGTLRLIGTGSGPSDKDRIDSTLILVNGEPLPDSLKHKIMGNDMDDIDTYMPRYFSQQGLMIDSVYVHKDSEFTTKYGGRAKYGVIEITTVPGNQEELLATLPDFVPDENEVRLLPQGVIGGSHNSPPNDSILYLINGVPQPKENNKWLDKRSYLDYFKGQHLLVSKVMRHMNEEAKQRYIEKFGEAAKHGVIEYICVEDTLCDYYMDQHEELKASRRRVSGVVYDENDEPLEHTMIYIWHEKRVWGFETTDSLGNFTFWVPRTDVKMEFTYVGFYKAVVVEPSDTFQTIYLLPNDNLKSLRESLRF